MRSSSSPTSMSEGPCKGPHQCTGNGTRPSLSLQHGGGGESKTALSPREKEHLSQNNKGQKIESSEKVEHHQQIVEVKREEVKAEKVEQLQSAMKEQDVQSQTSVDSRNSSSSKNDDRENGKKRLFDEMSKEDSFIGRRGDPRMHRAVAVRLQNPELSLFGALMKGGFRFPDVSSEAQCKGVKSKRIYDTEHISLSQRKNQLSRRLRFHARKKAKEQHHQMMHMNNRHLNLVPTSVGSNTTFHPQAKYNEYGPLQEEIGQLKYDSFNLQTNPSLHYQQRVLQERRDRQFFQIRNTINSLCAGAGASLSEQSQMLQRMVHVANSDLMHMMMNGQLSQSKHKPAYSLAGGSSHHFSSAPIPLLSSTPQLPPQLKQYDYLPLVHPSNPPPENNLCGGLNALPVGPDNNALHNSSTNTEYMLRLQRTLDYYRQYC